ncbi:hypothetical protein AVEN_76311-1 [Araneus ventricosus]|uniref:Uncharacterized protein n=1 Tax=Araneus ventricosus TaxID=182803 RepID=A0A4Y2MPD7_ARAVE|nr:hypothetical protein AVEN_76311-1 [Araneus ventricosus]
MLPYSKCQGQWDSETDNKLHSIKPILQLWLSLTNRKSDALLTRLSIGYTRFTHSHLLLGEPASVCSQCNYINECSKYTRGGAPFATEMPHYISAVGQKTAQTES